MAGSTDSPLHGTGASSPCRQEDELRQSSTRSHSTLASDVSFRSSVASSSSSSSSLCYSDGESDYGDGMYPWTQCEYEEIPSFRWIPSPLRWWKTKKRSRLSKRSSAAGAASRGEEPGPTGDTGVDTSGERKGLVHIDGQLSCTLEDLLSASAEVLGRGSFGTSYMATLGDGTNVAVKRLKEEAAREFEAEVNLLGKIRHPNILALRAYFYSPDEKFLVFDYMPRGSLSAFLHAHRNGTVKDWPTRMNIAIAISSGLNYLHTQENMVHGNLTSVNILLDDHTHARIADYGLSNLFSAAAKSTVMETVWASGYHAPEISKLEEVNTKTDVYSLGVILLELLTGKSPRGLDLRRWVGLITEEWKAQVFDPELVVRYTKPGGQRQEDELRDTLKLALHCVDPSPNSRPETQQVLQQLEEIKSGLARTTTANKPTVEAVGVAGTTTTAAPTTEIQEARMASPSEDPRIETSETPNILANDGNLQAHMTRNVDSSPSASPAPTAEMKATPINPSSSQVDLREGDIPPPAPVEEIAQGHSPNTGLQATGSQHSFIRFSPAQLEGGIFNMDEKAFTEDKTGVSPLSSIDWAKVPIEVRLEAPASPPLISSDPDLIYQRYFQTLYDLAHRSPPLPSNVLEVQLNTMIMGLHSLGYPLEAWLRAGTLVLVYAKKREYVEHHVDDYKDCVGAQLKELTLATGPVKEELSRARSDMTTFQKTQEGLDETICKLEFQVAVLKALREVVVDSVAAARDQFQVAEAKMETAFAAMDRMNQQVSAIPGLRSVMLQELLCSLDEAFDCSFREIMTKKF